MNNNDFYGNLDKIRKLYLREDFEAAVKIADKMDFKRLKEWKYIAMLINLYEAVGRLEDVRYFCILAYNKNLGGKKLIYKLTKVSIRLEDIDEAEDLYEEFCEIASRDSKRYELLYELKVIQGAKMPELIKILEDYMKRDLDEKYAYTLAEMYAKSGLNDKCIAFCDRIIERFEDGEVADRARQLREYMVNPMAGQSGGFERPTEAPQRVKAQPQVDLPVGQGIVGQNTIGLNVEQIMAESSNDSYMGGSGNPTQTIQLEEIMLTQTFEPQNIPMTDTQDVPIQNLYDTQDVPVQNLYDTQDVDISGQKEATVETMETPVEKVVEETVEASVGEKVEEPVEQPVEETFTQQAETPVVEPAMASTTVIPTQEIAQAEQEALSEENPPVYEENNNGQLEFTESSFASGNTVRVDAEAINDALDQVTRELNFTLPQESSTQDIESTVAMVEAALANETRAAQFDARMDMPEYSEEQEEPVKEKVVLRPFQPEIDTVYEIPMAVKRYFTKYNYITGLEAQLGEYFESTMYEDKMGTSGIGNIIISGNRSSDKTTLAINIVKALNVLYPENVRKIARTTSENINQRGLERSLQKLMGAALIVENAGGIDRQRVLELVTMLEGQTDELLIILEDSESEINELLKNNPELIEKFNHRITYKQFTVNELVEMCKRYADKCNYTIDEKALLQLYLRIDNIHSNSDGVSLEDVREVVDEAMDNAKKRAAKKLFGSAKKKKVGDKDYMILVEADFKE